MGKSIKIKKIFNIILILLLIISCCFSVTGCLPSSSGSGGGSGSGGSGSGGSASGGSGGGSSSAIEITSDSEDDFFSGVLIMYDAGHSGQFYDDATKENKTFKELLHRQFETFTTHLLYALNVIYGDDSEISSSQGVVNLLSVNSELGSYWGQYDTLGVNNATILSETNASGSYVLNTNDFTNNKSVVASSFSTLAGLGMDVVEPGQFYFNQAIRGGYTYIKDDGDEPLGEFSADINNANAWTMNVQGVTTSEAIRNAIANIVLAKTYSSGANLSYQECVENIEYLGFSPNDLVNIAEYVKKEIIGTAYDIDERIRQSVPYSAIDITAPNKLDAYPDNTDIHYYKGYTYVVDILVERMAHITTEGIYSIDSTFDSYNDDSKVSTYIILPRTNIEIRRCSELFVEDTGSNDLFGGGLLSQSSSQSDTYTPVLDNIKLKQIVFLPKLSESVKKKYLEELEDYYKNKNEDYTKYIDYRFDIMSVNMSFNSSSEVEGNINEFIFLPTFTIMAEGEIVHSGLVDNEPASMSGITFESFYDKYAINMNDVYSNMNDGASYSVGNVMSGSKFSDYNGVEVFDDNNAPNAIYFHSDNGEENLIAGMVASTYLDDSLYSVLYTEDGQFNFIFNGGDNFLQVDYSYFDMDSVDIYDVSKAKVLPPQVIDLVTLSIWT